MFSHRYPYLMMITAELSVILYRGPFLLIFYLFLLSVNIAVWTKFGVNYIRIFQLKGRRLTPQLLLRISLLLWTIWLICYITTYVHNYLPINPFVFPLILISFLVVYLFNPFNICLRSSRWWLIKTIWRLVAAPFYHVTFADFWLGDQLVSMSQAMKDLEFIGCFYINKFKDGVNTIENTAECGSGGSIPMMIAGTLPNWFRAAQCVRRFVDTREGFPHLANTLKYSLGFIDVTLSYLNYYYSTHPSITYLYYAFLTNKVISTLYSYYWDIFMDWGLIKLDGCVPVWARQKLLYKYRSLYYLAMLEDLLLRFTWLYVILMKLFLGPVLPDQTYATVVALLEVFRRFVWNFFRVENEHVNNCGHFREVTEIPPLNQALVQQLELPANCNTKKRLKTFGSFDDSDDTKPLLSNSPKSSQKPAKSQHAVRCYNTMGTSNTHLMMANNRILEVV